MVEPGVVEKRARTENENAFVEDKSIHKSTRNVVAEEGFKLVTTSGSSEKSCRTTGTHCGATAIDCVTRVKHATIRYNVVLIGFTPLRNLIDARMDNPRMYTCVFFRKI